MLAGLITETTLPDYARDRIAAARRFAREDLLHRRFALPLLDVDCWFSEPRLRELCNERLAERADGETARDRIEVFIMDATLPGWEAPVLWDVRQGFTSRDFETALERVGLRGFYHHEAPSWQFHDPVAGAGVHILPQPMAIPPWESGSPLRLFLHWAYARMGMRLTHAATLGAGTAGALVVGASGSGKSGTTLAGLLNGLTSAGDDYVLIEPAADITAHAVFRVFKQDEAGLRRVGLDPVAIGSKGLNWHGKHEFDAAALKPSGFARQLRINAILVPNVARLPRTRIEPMSPGQAALSLAPSAVLQLQGDMQDGFRFFADLTRRLPAFRVHLSEDPAEIADAIGRHLMQGVALAG